MQRLFDVHFRSVVMLTQELLPLLADGGRILNVSTGLTRSTWSTPRTPCTRAMKAAVEVSPPLPRQVARRPRGIAVNVLAPGATATDFGGGEHPRQRAVPRPASSRRHAMGRVGEPDDIGRAAAAILSEGMGWVTGQRIEAAGGMRL